MIRALICDDEKPARIRLKNLLAKEADIHIISEAKDGKEALTLISTLKPDLVFLDIQMPELTGIELVKQLKNPPYIIFVTAYDKYAINAFELNSLDYILKPYSNKRFKESLERARTSFEIDKQLEFGKKLNHLVKQLANSESEFREEIEFKEDGLTTSIFVSDLFYIQSFSNYLKLHLAKEDYLYRFSLEGLENELNPMIFLRIHRSLIINKAFIKHANYLTNNEYEFELTNGVILKSGRSYSDKISVFLSKTV